MMNYKILFSTVLTIMVGTLSAYYVPEEGGRESDSNTDAQVEFRIDCVPGRSIEDLDINNVRARLRHSGSLFWDAAGNGRYIVPKVDPASGEEEVSSIFAGGIWLGGRRDGSLFTAISAYGLNQGNVDFYPGPLEPSTGEVTQQTCADWDKHFVVLGRDISDFLNLVEESGVGPNGVPETPIDVASIPTGVLGWPARGNKYFSEIHDFDLPFTNQGLAGFYDADEDGIYDPAMGDYPIIEIRDCPEGIYPDMMVFWIFNDNGNTHLESNGLPIRMEVQVQSFAFSTSDEINNMTFYRYKLINRAPQEIDSMFFANWADPDLGCSDDDYIGCDTTSSVGYVYNADAVDGSTGPTCPNPGGGNTPTYGNSPPMLGIDYFRGPLAPERALDSIVPVEWVNMTSLINVIDEMDLGDGTKRITGTIQDEFGMSSFIYNSRAGTGCPGATNDPVDAQQAYGFLSGTWTDGTPLTRGGNGYNPGSATAEVTKYVFPDNPASTADDVWSMCCPDAGCTPLPDCDFRFLQASGPLTLTPGAVNELIVGVVWVPEIPDYPCPNVQTLLEADVAAQGLFDNCFDLLDGPEAPDMNIIELDRELILTLNNPSCSNNFNQGYQERDIFAPENLPDSLAAYLFEGYTIYQLRNQNIGLEELGDSDKARIIASVDVRNGVSDVYNWEAVRHPNPDSPAVFIPVLQAQSDDEGIDNAFQVQEDQFAGGETRLINHKAYYYLVLAYAYNNYREFNEEFGTGQSRLYLQGRQSSCERPIQVYTGIPRPLTQDELNADFGEGAQVTRLEGAGVGGQFVDITSETEDAIMAGEANGEVTYKPGEAPILIEVFNPLQLQDGEFVVRIVDNDLEDDEVAADATWQLFDSDNTLLYESLDGIDRFNQVLLQKYGFAVSLGQTFDVPEAFNDVNIPRNGDPDFGMIGTEIEYEDPAGDSWYGWWPDTDALPGIDPLRPALDYIATGTDQNDQDLDINEYFSGWTQTNSFTPHFIIDFRNGAYINPIYQNARSRGDNRQFDETLNNVDIVFTNDKSKWSRAAVVEMFQQYHENTQLGESEQGAEGWDLRPEPSVGKEDADGDGYADPDGAVGPGGEPMIGMGWFPGYAIDVETGERLNVFFGENSLYSIDNFNISGVVDTSQLTGGDLMWNPDNSGTPFLGNLGVGPAQEAIVNYASAMHSIYVTDEPYDECEEIRTLLASDEKDDVAKMVRWVSLPFVQPTSELLSYADGLIPNTCRIKLRAQSAFKVISEPEEEEQFDGYPTYRFSYEGAASNPIAFGEEESELDFANVVPNPYYGFSAYETQPQTGVVKITNLPALCTVSIYTLDGKFIRQFDRDERTVMIEDPTAGVCELGINPAIEWDLENYAGIPVTSGVYLIHIQAPGIGEKVLKWFGVKRKFNPQGN